MTRIRPPDDVIKLEDRLYYVLQPSLELLVAQQSLEFPLRPFQFQLEGVAFLYPRISAVLADEMGLGKTMQAITAARMLLRRRNPECALGLPQAPRDQLAARVFALAPELPTIIVEGDPDRRAWQWELPSVPVKIANYELLCRDAQLIAAAKLQFDLVILDESQRIKNRSSLTSEVVCGLTRRAQLGPDGNAGREFTRRFAGHFRIRGPAAVVGQNETARVGLRRRQFYPPPHERRRACRSAP